MRLWRARLEDCLRVRLVEDESGTVTHIREPLATANVLALVRLLAGMCANVHRQGASLDEALATAGRCTSVGSLVGVNAVVSLQVGLAVEALGCC